MTVNDTIKLAVSFILLSVASVALAQDTRDDEADVILTIEEQWEAEQNGDEN